MNLHLLGYAALLATCVLVLAPSAGAAGSELCPIATKRLHRSIAYQRSDNVIRAPATAGENAALMRTLQNGQGEARMFAIMRLALAGNLAGFQHLLTSADVDGVFIYSSHYLNRDDTVCIDPELERALLEGVDESGLGRSLVALLDKNTYRSERVLHALLAIPLDPKQANRYHAFGRAVTATHLAGIEARVLEHARSLLPFDNSGKKYESPSLHQHYVQFFSERGYAPAVAYFRELLVQADRSEPVQAFHIKYGMLRISVQRGLAAIGGADAHAAFVAELEAIASRPLDPFAASELQIIGQLAPSLDDAGTRDAIVDSFERLLGIDQPAEFDYQMRRTVYETLPKLLTPRSMALLIAELERYVGQDPPLNRESAVAMIFTALASLEHLDVAPLLALVDDLKRPAERAALLNILTAVQVPEQQNRARDGLDALFDEGVLAEADYMASVTALNAAIGNESPRYVALREEQNRERAARQAARRTEAEEQGKREMQATFAIELDRHSSAEGVAKNITLLANSGGPARRAAQWLIIVGAAALPQLHEALAASDSGDRLNMQVMNVIGEIGSPSSTEHLIAAAQARADGGFHRSAFFALALIPSTPRAIAFAEAQLVNDVADARQIAGLVYLARMRHEPAAGMVSRFTADGLPTRVRSAGFYLGARLGVPGIAAQIGEALEQTTDRSELEALLQSLAAAATDQTEFATLATAVGFGERSFSYRESLAYCAFRTAPNERKAELAYEVLATGGTWYRREALRYLVATDPQGTVDRLTGGMGQYLPLHMLLPQSATLQLLFSESRRMGYRLAQTSKGYVLASYSNKSSSMP